MTFLGIIAVIAAAVGLGWSIERRFQARTYPLAWKVAVGVLGVVGLGFGIWLLTREYLASPTLRLTGYPFAVAGCDLFDGRWVCGRVSSYAPLVLVADMAAGVGICLLPLRMAQFFYERGAKTKNLSHAV